jgi:hypothetical protein
MHVEDLTPKFLRYQELPAKRWCVINLDRLHREMVMHVTTLWIKRETGPSRMHPFMNNFGRESLRYGTK